LVIGAGFDPPGNNDASPRPRAFFLSGVAGAAVLVVIRSSPIYLEVNISAGSVLVERL
jgi:hypothetical protein